jgi:hypothetical protein
LLSWRRYSSLTLILWFMRFVWCSLDFLWFICLSFWLGYDRTGSTWLARCCSNYSPYPTLTPNCYSVATIWLPSEQWETSSSICRHLVLFLPCPIFLTQSLAHFEVLLCRHHHANTSRLWSSGSSKDLAAVACDVMIFSGRSSKHYEICLQWHSLMRYTMATVS